MKTLRAKDHSRLQPLASPGGSEPGITSNRYTSKIQWKAGLFTASILLALISMFFILMDLELHSNWTIAVTLLFTTWSLVFLFTTYRYHRSIYLFTTAYLLSLAVFHLGHIVADSVGWFRVDYLHAGEMAPWHERAGWYVLLSFGCYGIGVALSMKSRVLREPHREPSRETIDENMKSVFWIGMALFLASLTALVLLVGSVGNILRFSRAEIFGGVGDTRGFGFFLLVAPSAMVLLVAGARSRPQKYFAYGLAAATLLIVLLLGYRSSALFPALIGAIIWVKTGRRIPLPVAIISIIVVLIAIPTVSTLRSLGAYKDISGEDISRSLEQSDIHDVFLQLGGVSTIIAHVLKWVPAEDPYRYGQSYLLAVRNAIPNIGFDIGESGRENAYDKGVIDKDQIRLMNPGDWYIYKTSQYMFRIGGGSGFSTIAEAYLNFGLPGVILYFLALGYLLGRLEQVNLSASPKALIFSGSMLWPLLKSVRNPFGVFLKPVVFVLVSILIWKAASAWLKRKR